MRAIFSLVLAAIWADVNIRARAAKGDSTAAYFALCELWNAAKKASTITLPPLPTTDAYEDIEKFNMSLADEKWKQMIDAHKSKQGWQSYKKEQGDKLGSVDWAATWPRWQTARDATKDTNNDWYKNNRPGFSENQAPEVQDIVNRTTFTASKLYAALIQKPQDSGTDMQTKIRALAQEAMCGTEDKYKYENGKCKDITGSDTVKTTTCAKAQSGLNLGLDIACLCTGNTADHCSSGAAAFRSGSGTMIADSIKTLTDACPKSDDSRPLHDAIQQGIARAKALISSQNTGALHGLGKTAGTSCTAATDWCVDYTAYFSSTKTFDSIPWVSKLQGIANLQRKYEQELTKKAATKTAIEQLRDAAQMEYTRKRTQWQMTMPGGQHPAPINQDKLIKATKECEKQANKTAEQCTKLGCDHDAENKKCKPKPGTETTVTGAGEQATGAAATGCEKHFTDENGCKKMNEGKEKPVCAWKKGGEGDKDKDELRRRNDSFLVNKKFSMIASSIRSLVQI
uniref:Variant surface glycoprotein (VSG, atypical), putative n=1 Tax=Trypanosoma brucei brucei (strain 927/4 GUTat10.1) TaxID=185431 RepID=Q4FKK6_TRYB2|nr:variant surface glycoprotein (VSG, atypical), putative [Trypanosoma brucei brucei TREU927]